MSDQTPAGRLAAEGLDAQSWSNAPGVVYAVHSHDYDKVIVVGAGSIAFHLVERCEWVDLAVGDRLELPAGTAHGARVGPSGVTCLEAHRAAGALGDEPHRRRTGDW
jgi:quercetin dioxygenase-like cupin family protein